MAQYDDVRGPAHFDSDPDDNLVDTYVDFVYMVARQEFPSSVGYVDSNDLAQESLLKLHLLPHREAIVCPHAYIRQLVHRQAIDMRRKNRTHQLIVTDDEGELHQGKALVSMSEQYANPETLFEEDEATTERVILLANAIAGMHSSLRQQRATITRLQEKWDDFPRLAAMLKSRNIDCEVAYPEDRYERQKLQSSYAPARRKLAETFKVDLRVYR